MNIDKFTVKYGPASENYRGNRHETREVFKQAEEFIAAWESQESTEAAPFTDDTTKTEMIDHLVNIHGLSQVSNKAISTYSGTKATKDELKAAHESLHERQDGPDAEFDSRAVRTEYNKATGKYDVVAQFRLGGAAVPLVKHHHAAVTISPEAAATLGRVRNNQRASSGVLSVQDRKVLTELVNNDFSGLKQEMRAFATDSLFAKKQDIDTDWDRKEKSIPDFAKQATEARRKYDEEAAKARAEYEAKAKTRQDAYEDKMKVITEAAKDKGVTLVADQTQDYNERTGRNVTRTFYTASVEGRKEALAAAEKENKSFLDRALLTLEKQRLDAQRQVLLSGVPEGALPILEGIPDAKSMMIQAQNQQNTPQLGASTTS